MFDDQLRRWKDKILSLISGLFFNKISPNQITTASFITGLAALIPLYRNNAVLAFVLWMLNRILDGLDGLVARQTNRQSDFGGYYDILTDFIIYALIPVTIALREQSPLLSFMTILLLAVFYVNGASWMFLSGLLEKQKNQQEGILTSLTMPRGIIEGTETIIFYSLFILLPNYIPYLMGLMAILTALGIPLRLVFARKHLQ